MVGLFEKLCACQNREIVYDLYSYVWDMCSVILTLNGFVQWLSRGVCSPKLQRYHSYITYALVGGKGALCVEKGFYADIF